MSDETTAPRKAKKPRHRSPEHPICDLETALTRARSFYTEETTHWASPSAALDHWGFAAGNSKGLRYLAALKHFGLLEQSGTSENRKVRVTQRARLLLLNPDIQSREWRDAIRECALGPKIYQELWEEWGATGKLPSEKTMAFELKFKWEFNEKVVDRFIRDFRATMEFAGLLSGDILQEEMESDLGAGEEDQEDDPSRRKARAPMVETAETEKATVKPEVLDFTIPLRGAGVAVLSIPVPLSDHNFTQLEEWLKWAQDSLVYHGEDDE